MQFFKEYIAEDKLTLVAFHASWCKLSKKMCSFLAEYKKATGNTARILKIDVDAPANREKVHEYRVESLPVLMFFRHGEKLWQGDGIICVAELVELSEKLSAVL